VEQSRPWFLACVCLHFMVFVPTIPLGSSIVLHSITDRTGQFPGIRVFGTLGWIIAGVVIGTIPGAAITDLPLKMGGVAGLLLGLYAFTLPNVPPTPVQGGVPWRELTGLDMLQRLRERDFGLFIIGVLLMNVPLAYFNNFMEEAGVFFTLLGQRIEPAAIQTLGQASELAFLLLLPFFLRRFGVKGVLVVGMLAWALRYGLFSLGAADEALLPALVVLGVLLHGVCYDFFFVAGQIYVDGRFDPASRSRAQAFLVLINMGVGVIIASNLANAVYGVHTVSAVEHEWSAIWALPAGVALVAGLMFAAFFKSGLTGEGPGVHRI
jgi:nucleoside transporter